MGQTAASSCPGPAASVCRAIAAEGDAAGEEPTLLLRNEALGEKRLLAPLVTSEVKARPGYPLLMPGDAELGAKDCTFAEPSDASTEADSPVAPAVPPASTGEPTGRGPDEVAKRTSNLADAAAGVPSPRVEGSKAAAQEAVMPTKAAAPSRAAAVVAAAAAVADAAAESAAAAAAVDKLDQSSWRPAVDAQPSKEAAAPKTQAKGRSKAKAKAKATGEVPKEVKPKAAKKQEPKVERDEIGRDVKRPERAKQASRGKVVEEASDESSSDVDLGSCPASKKDQAFEKELKKVKKQIKLKMTPQQIEEMSNPWLTTDMSAPERQLNKELFVSFYRGEYAKIKLAKGPEKETGPDLKQYSQESVAGLKLTDGHRPMARPRGIEVPKDFRQPVGTLTAKELAAKNCASNRMLLCIHGDLFDVSDRPDKYGKDGPYHYMTGHDMTWGLVVGDDAEEFLDKYYDIFKVTPKEKADRKLQGLMSWWAFYENEYGEPVGRLDIYQKEWELPPPPSGSMDNECSVM
mmetsp:Transcript_85004/g.243956  ORF Transcript_85004/g.243956 Transcript_85004/m.243956 type:complete len:518 (+) Transcript_85004:234-1787(+)